jgi:ornithine--oxo-acid transaminase
VLGPGSHGTTYGANPLACAVALAALDVIEEEALAERALELGEYFADRLRGLSSPVIKDVRGRGLFIGLELTRPVEPYRAELRRRGILCAGMGLNFRLLPPLVITREELDWALERLGEALAEEL